MNQQTYRNSFMVGAVAIGVIAGAAVGFFTAQGMGGTGSVSAAPAPAGEMGEMKGMSMEQMDMKKMAPAGEKSMEGMPGMSAAPSGGVVIPAVMRQLIGVRSAPVDVAELGQEIRAVGMVGYDERG